MYHSSLEVIYVSVYLTHKYRLSVTADLLVTLEVLQSVLESSLTHDCQEESSASTGVENGKYCTVRPYDYAPRHYAYLIDLKLHFKVSRQVDLVSFLNF